MSIPSRVPHPISAASPASYPVLIDSAGRIDRAKLRDESRYMVSHCGFDHAGALARLMQKARLQLKWARAEGAERATREDRAAAAQAALEAEAQGAAARHHDDVSALTF